MDWLGTLVPSGTGHLAAVDACAVVLYLAGLAGVTIYVSRRVGSADAEHYFLGGRDLPFWAIGFSLFASNLGTDHLVGLAGSGAAQGLAVGTYEWAACYVLLVLGWVFVPHYLASDIYTVPEYLEKRFDRSFRIFFTWLTIVATVLTKISVTIFAGAVVMKEVLDWNMWISSIVLLALTGFYTSIGGLAAVVYTEVLQSLILIIGSAALLWYGLTAVGGWSGLREKLPDGHFKILKPADHPDFPWPGVLIGLPISSVWYWCTDQVMVQRVLASKSVSVGQSACVFAGWLKISPMFIMVLPGLIAAALYPEEIAEDSNRAFALLVTKLLPVGWQGPMIAVMLSSFMAALASCFNSCSTLFTMDVYARCYPEHTEAELVRVGRVFTVLLAAISVAWLPMIESATEELFLYIQGMQVIWCSPIAAVFLASVTCPTLTSRSAWVALILGLVAGVLFWASRSVVPQQYQIEKLTSLNILHFAVLLFAFDVAILVCLHIGDRSTFSLEYPDETKALLPARLTGNSAQEWAGPTAKAAAVLLVAAVTGMGVYLSI